MEMKIRFGKRWLAVYVGIIVLLNKLINFVGAYVFFGLGLLFAILAMVLVGIRGHPGDDFFDENSIGEWFLALALPMVLVDLAVPYFVLFSVTIPSVGFDASVRAIFGQLAERLFTGFMILVGACFLCLIGAAYYLLAESYILNGPIQRTKQLGAAGNDGNVTPPAGVSAVPSSYDFCAQRKVAPPMYCPPSGRSVACDDGKAAAFKGSEHEPPSSRT